jgi:hypothetical protein
MVYPRFMDNQPTGRGVYVVRRILAVLVLLLLLALLVPQAYQALLGPRDETGSGVQETAVVGSFGDDEGQEEDVLNGETAGVADKVAEQEDDSDNPSHSGEASVGEGAAKTSRGLETSDDEYGGEESIELDADLVRVAEVFEEVAVGDVDQTVPTPVIDAGDQQSIQPIVPVDLLATAEPVMSEDVIIPQGLTYYDYPVYYEDPAYYDYPIYYGDPAYYDYAVYYGNPAYYEYPVYYEEQILEESETSYTYYVAAVATTSTQEEGGAAAYAAVGGGGGAYAATSTG